MQKTEPMGEQIVLEYSIIGSKSVLNVVKSVFLLFPVASSK